LGLTILLGEVCVRFIALLRLSNLSKALVWSSL